MLNLHWIEIIILLGAFQGIFISLTIKKISKRNERATDTLAWILIMSSIILLGRILFFRFQPTWPYQITLIPDTVIFLFGPLIYFFVKRLLFYKQANGHLHYLHFLPAVLHLVATAYTFKFDNATYRSMAINGQLFLYFNITEGIGILLNMFYLILSFLKIRSYKSVPESYSNRKSVNYLTLLLVVISLVVLTWLSGFISTLAFNNPSLYDIIWIVVPCIAVIIAYYTLAQPEIFKVVTTSNKNSNRLSDSSVLLIQGQLETLMNEDKLYKKAKLTLNELANRLNITTNQLSWVINNVYGCNFYDYLNEYRIKDFVQKLENNSHQKLTLLALAYEVGFNSKTTFNKSFKKVMNFTPKEYMNRTLAPELATN